MIGTSATETVTAVVELPAAFVARTLKVCEPIAEIGGLVNVRTPVVALIDTQLGGVGDVTSE